MLNIKENVKTVARKLGLTGSEKYTAETNASSELINALKNNKVPMVFQCPPPKHIYDAVKKKINPDIRWENGIVFTYGYNIHSIRQLTPDLLVHEMVHVRQQTTGPLSPDEWWERYLEDSDFRLAQETEAYKEQVVFLRKVVKNREDVAKQVHRIAQLLSGPIYGNLISYQQAMSAISK